MDDLKWGKHLDALRAAGIKTMNARGFRGGKAANGDIVVTAWIDQSHKDGGTFPIWRPKTNHGGLLEAWQLGGIKDGAKVRVILLRRRGSKTGPAVIHKAALVGYARVVDVKKGKGATIKMISKK